MLTNTTKALKPKFYEFLLVLCCISCDTMNFLQSLLKFREIPKDSFLIFWVLNAVFFTVCPR